MIKKYILLFLTSIVFLFASIYGCVLGFSNIEVVQAKPVGYYENKDYPLVSDKKYSVDVLVDYKYNGIKRDGLIEMDRRYANAADNVSVFVLKSTGNVVHNGIVMAPAYMSLISVFAVIFCGFNISKLYIYKRKRRV